MTIATPLMEPLNLCDGRLWLLGGVTPPSERISWQPAGAVGYESLNCYLLLEEAHALLLDTGVAVHEREVAAQLEALVGRTTPLSIYITRIELDAVSGLGSVVERFDVRGIYASSGFNTNPLEFFDGMADDPRHGSLRIERRQHGEHVDVSGGRALEVIRPVLRLLPTSWAFDAATGTLFTSDAFGHVPVRGGASGADPRLASPQCGSAEATARHLLTKFDWVRDVEEPAFIADGVAEVFDTHDVTCIAPTHGCVIQGATLVRRHRDWLLDAIRNRR